MIIVRAVLRPYEHLKDIDKEIYREWTGDILRVDGNPMTEDDALYLKLKYDLYDVYSAALISPAY